MAKKTKRKVSTISQGGVAAFPVNESVEQAASEVISTSAAPRSFVRRTPTQEFNPDYSYVISDLKRIGILAGSFFVLLIALSFIMPLILP
jgi:hypothetical protein